MEGLYAMLQMMSERRGGEGGSGGGGGGGVGGTPSLSLSSNSTRVRTVSDFVHDPPRSIRRKYKTWNQTELYADVKRRSACDAVADSPPPPPVSSSPPPSTTTPTTSSSSKNLVHTIFGRETQPPPPDPDDDNSNAYQARFVTRFGQHFLPNAGVDQIFSTDRSRAYNISFGKSGKYCAAAWQDERIRIYNASTWELQTSIVARNIAWTVTASEIDPRERQLAYATITETAHLVKISADAVGESSSAAADEERDDAYFGDGNEYDEYDDDGNMYGPGHRRNNWTGANRGQTIRSMSNNTTSAATTATTSSSSSSSTSPSTNARNRATERRVGGGDYGADAHIPLDFSRVAVGEGGSSIGGGSARGSDGRFRGRGGGGFGIFGLKWSAGGSELLAGCSDGTLRIMDVEAGLVTDKVVGGNNDINSVCFAGGIGDASDVVISGSDDVSSPLKVWDRRVLTSPVGSLPGHVAGITHVAPRGDGIHILSVSKDQTIKIWDLRKQLSGSFSSSTSSSSLSSSSSAGGESTSSSSSSVPQSPALKRLLKTVSSFDYRWERFPGIRVRDEALVANDASLLTLTGPSIYNTLIRANFSPLGAAGGGGRYIASGSADRNLYIWDLFTGEIVNIIKFHQDVIRDVAWHPLEPLIASASWDGSLGQFRYKDHASAKVKLLGTKWKYEGKQVRAKNRAERVAGRTNINKTEGSVTASADGADDGDMSDESSVMSTVDGDSGDLGQEEEVEEEEEDDEEEDDEEEDDEEEVEDDDEDEDDEEDDDDDEDDEEDDDEEEEDEGNSGSNTESNIETDEHEGNVA